MPTAAASPPAVLDLSAPPAPATPPRAAEGPRTPVARRARPERLPYPRLPPGGTLVLDRSHPTVTLTRVQSGIGQLAVSLAASPSTGDLTLGMVLQTDDGVTQVVQRLGDALAAPTPGSPLPLVRLATEGGHDALLLDLRGVRRLRRSLVYGFSPAVAMLTWDGLVTVGLHDGARVEVPFDLPPLSGTVALLTIYNVHGELVLRSELTPYAGPPEAAAVAYGYHHTWLQGRLPAS